MVVSKDVQCFATQLEYMKPLECKNANPVLLHIGITHKRYLLEVLLNVYDFLTPLTYFSPPAVFRGVDLQSKGNNRAHHTEEIGTERLVVRRGQPFSILLHCTDSPPLPPNHQLTLVLNLGQLSTLNTQSTRVAMNELYYSILPSEFLVQPCKLPLRLDIIDSQHTSGVFARF